MEEEGERSLLLLSLRLHSINGELLMHRAAFCGAAAIDSHNIITRSNVNTASRSSKPIVLLFVTGFSVSVKEFPSFSDSVELHNHFGGLYHNDSCHTCVHI